MAADLTMLLDVKTRECMTRLSECPKHKFD